MSQSSCKNLINLGLFCGSATVKLIRHSSGFLLSQKWKNTLMHFQPPQAAFLQIPASNPTGFTVGFLFLPAAQGQELWSNFFQKQTNRSHISLSAALTTYLPLPCAEWAVISSILQQHRFPMKVKLKNVGRSFIATEIKTKLVSLSGTLWTPSFEALFQYHKWTGYLHTKNTLWQMFKKAF